MTLAEFAAYANGYKNRERREWERTAAFMALTANIHRGRSARSYKTSDFNPYAKEEQQRLPTEEELEYLNTWPVSRSFPSSST
jgi:hypothetical protein